MNEKHDEKKDKHDKKNDKNLNKSPKYDEKKDRNNKNMSTKVICSGFCHFSCHAYPFCHHVSRS